MFTVDGQPVGKAMKERKSNLVHQFQPPINKPTENDIEKAAKEILKNSLQYQPDDRPTMKQVMEQLSQLKEKIVRIGNFEVIVSEKHMLWEYERKLDQETAYLGQHVTTEQLVTAVRHTMETTNTVGVALYENEYPLLHSIITPHENIIQAYHSSKKEYEKDGKEMVDIWIIIEHCQFGNIADYAKEHELTVRQKLQLMIQAGRAVCHLHEQQPVNVVHRYINSLSLLVSGTPQGPVIKLARFYDATIVNKDDPPFSMQSLVGSKIYLAPEMTQVGDTFITQLVYDVSVDVFALGINCLELLGASKGSYMAVPEGEYINVL